MPTSPKHTQRGVYASYKLLPGEAVGEPIAHDVVVHSAEIRALRDAITSGKYVVFVTYGQSVEDAHRATQADDTVTAAPLPVPVDEPADDAGVDPEVPKEPPTKKPRR